MPNPGFLLAEDAAVKTRFSQLTVTDDRNPARPVKVYFRYPEAETERDYPFITIELVDIIHARNRQHSEVALFGWADGTEYDAPNEFTYWPSTSASINAYGDGLLSTWEFIPVDLLYQVSTYSRSALHDRQLTSQIMQKVAPLRWGAITIPEDGTVRRFDLLDWITADLLDPEAGYRKRIFRKVYTVQMTAELPVSTVIEVEQALSITTDIINTDSQQSEQVIITE